MRKINVNKSLIIFVTKIYLLIFGFGWIFIYLYSRLFIKSSPYYLKDIKNTITNEYYIVFLLFILLHIIIIASIIIKSYIKKRTWNTTSFFSNGVKKVVKITEIILWNPLEFIHELIAPKIPKSGDFFLYLEDKWSKNNYNKYYFYNLIFIFSILPKIVVAIIFFIDVVLYAQYKFFLYSVSLLIIPILFNIFLKLFISFANRNAPVLKNYFSKIEYIGNTYDEHKNIITSNPYAYAFHLKPEYHGVVDPQEEIKLLFQLESINNYGSKIKEDITYITPYITLITSFIYLFSGFYRIIYLII